MAYLPSGGLSELVQLRPGFLHILRTRALTECDLIVVIDRDPPVAVFADPFENRVTEPAQPYGRMGFGQGAGSGAHGRKRSEEHTSELQSLMRISYAVFCLKKKTHQHTIPNTTNSYSAYQ